MQRFLKALMRIIMTTAMTIMMTALINLDGKIRSKHRFLKVIRRMMRIIVSALSVRIYGDDANPNDSWC